MQAKNTSPDPSRKFGPFPIPQHTSPARDVRHFPFAPVIAICLNLFSVLMSVWRLTYDGRLVSP